jgi:Ca-activated chloride channel family protein
MEYKAPWLPVLGALVTVIWALDFWKIWWGHGLPISGLSARKQLWRQALRLALFIIGLAGWAWLSYSLSQPRSSRTFSPSSREVNDIVLVMDVSRSMLAEDVRPNRLEVAKEKLREFARARTQDRLGLVIFSEKVFTLLPLSTDPALLDKVIADIDVGYLGGGTNIGDGLALGVARAAESETKNKVIVLLTDGVANMGNLTPLQAAQEAKKHGIKVYTIGLGSSEDARIPVGRSVFGPQYQVIPGGSIDYKTLQEIANLTGGKFYPAKDAEGLSRIMGDINKLERTEIKVENQVVYDEHYHRYFALGLLLILSAEALRRTLLKEVV